MVHRSTIRGMAAMLALRLITVPTRAQPAKFDAIGAGNDTLSDALSATPDRETLAWAYKFVCHHARPSAGDNPVRDDYAERLGGNILQLERGGTGSGGSTNAAAPGGGSPALAVSLGHNEVEGGYALLGRNAYARDDGLLSLVRSRGIRAEQSVGTRAISRLGFPQLLAIDIHTG